MIDPGFEPRKININTVERQDLAIHPYITDKAASAIVAYRLNHGSFNSIDDIAKIPALDSITLRKSRPYLKISDNINFVEHGGFLPLISSPANKAKHDHQVTIGKKHTDLFSYDD